MKRAILALGLLILASPAAANECMALWLERNAYFANKGYCFGSALGKGVFGNSGCHTKNPSMSRSETQRIGQIKSREKALGCAAQKKSWSVSQVRGYAQRLTATPSQPAPAPAPRQTCSQSVALLFNVSNQFDIDPDLQVNGPYYVSISQYDDAAYVNAYGNDCVGGVYSYRYAVSYDALGDNPRKLFSGKFSVQPHDRECRVEITWHSGASYVSCN